MPTEVNDILGIMLGLVVLLILIIHSLPSLSNFFKEKIMGIKPPESFDLDELVQKKMNLYKMDKGQSQDLFEKNLQLHHKTQTLQFVHNLSWDSRACIDELNIEAQNIHLEDIPSIESMRQTYESLKRINGFEDGPALELNHLKRFLLFYALFFSKIAPDQRESFYQKSHLELTEPDLDIRPVVASYQADFSTQV